MSIFCPLNPILMSASQRIRTNTNGARSCSRKWTGRLGLESAQYLPVDKENVILSIMGGEGSPWRKERPVAKNFTGCDQGKVPGKNTLVGKIIQIFEKYGGNSANKDGLDGSVVLLRRLRVIHKLRVRSRWMIKTLSFPAAEDQTQLCGRHRTYGVPSLRDDG